MTTLAISPLRGCRLALRLLSVTAGLMLLGASSVAQTPAAAPAPPRLRFLFLDETPGSYALRFEKEERVISSGPYVISAPFTPSDFKPLKITKEFTEPGTGAPLREVVASVTPSPGDRSSLVIVTPRARASAEAPLSYAVEIIDCGPDRFPLGSIAIINRARATVAAKFGNEQAAVVPGQTTIVRPVTDSRHRVFSRIAAQTPAGWIPISDSVSVVRPQERVIGVFVYSPSGMRHTYTAYELAEFGPPRPGHFWLTFSDSL